MPSGGLKLRFKGDEPEKKKKKKKRTRGEEGGADKTAEQGPPDDNEQAWVAVERLTDLSGPSFLVAYVRLDADQEVENSRSRPFCLALNPALHRVEAHAIQPSPTQQSNDRTTAAAAIRSLDLDPELEGAQIVEGGDDDDHDIQADTASVPTDVNQVWVSTRVLDTPSTAPRITLRSAESQFVTAETTGEVSAIAEARGPLEEWTLRSSSSSKHRFCLESHGGTFLGLDEKAGGKMVVRSDFDTPQEWTIKVQWKYRAQARQKEEGEKPLRERDASFKRVKAA